MTLAEMAAEVSEGLARGARTPNILGYQPHPKQALFHASKEKGKLYIGGNRSGKTTGGIAEDVMRATGKHISRTDLKPPPTRGRIISVDFINGISKIIIPELARWLPPSELINGSWTDSYNASERKLTLENGSFIELMSYDQDLDKFAGTWRDYIHMDEEPPEAVFTENTARLIDSDGDWYITMTPVEGLTWTYDKIYIPGGVPGSGILVIEVDIKENPYIPQGVVDAFLQGLDKDEREARGRGKFIQIGGLVYKSFNPEIHVIDPLLPPLTHAHYVSMDHGFHAPTAFLWHAVSPKGMVITYDEHYQAETVVDAHAQIYHTKNREAGRRYPDLTIGDPAIKQSQGVTGESIQTAYARNGVYITPGNNEVLAGVNKVNSYLRYQPPQWYVTANCVNLIREIQRLRWKTWQNKKIAAQNDVRDEIHKKDDHACDALRYFFTIMPELAPVAPVSSDINKIVHEALRPVSGVPIGDVTDYNFDRVYPQTEWVQVDEYLGGLY